MAGPSWAVIDNLAALSIGSGAQAFPGMSADWSSQGPFYANGFAYFFEFPFVTGVLHSYARCLKSADMEVWTEVRPATLPTYPAFSGNAFSQNSACCEYINGGTHYLYLAVGNLEISSWIPVVGPHGTTFYTPIDLWRFDFATELWTLVYSGVGGDGGPQLGTSTAWASINTSSGDAFPWHLNTGPQASLVLRVNQGNGDVYFFHSGLGDDAVCAIDGSVYVQPRLDYSVYSGGTWTNNLNAYPSIAGGVSGITSAYIDASGNRYVVLMQLAPQGPTCDAFGSISPVPSYTLYFNGTVLTVLTPFSPNLPGCTSLATPFNKPNLVILDNSPVTGGGPFAPYNFAVEGMDGTFMSSFRSFGGFIYAVMVGVSQTVNIIQISGMTVNIVDTGQPVAVFNDKASQTIGMLGHAFWGQHLEIFISRGSLYVMWKTPSVPSRMIYTKVASTGCSGTYSYDSGAIQDSGRVDYNYAQISGTSLGALSTIPASTFNSDLGSRAPLVHEAGLMPVIVQVAGVYTTRGQVTVVTRGVDSRKPLIVPFGLVGPPSATTPFFPSYTHRRGAQGGH